MSKVVVSDIRCKCVRYERTHAVQPQRTDGPDEHVQVNSNVRNGITGGRFKERIAPGSCVKCREIGTTC